MRLTWLNNKFICTVSLIHLALATILLAVANYINIEMWIISFGFMISLSSILIVYSLIKKNSSYIKEPIKRVPYNLIPFILSMFTLISAVNSYGVFENIATILGNNQYNYLLTSTLSCNILNNIPMTLAFGSILENTLNVKYIYATIIGSNLGAILTPVGALAGIMWMNLLKTNDIKYTFLQFAKNGIIIVFALLFSSSIALFIL